MNSVKIGIKNLKIIAPGFDIQKKLYNEYIETVKLRKEAKQLVVEKKIESGV